MITLDLETGLIKPGRAAPRPVVAQSLGYSGPADLVADGVSVCLADNPAFLDLAREAVSRGCRGQNLPFDLGVLAEHGRSRVDDIFAGFDAGIYSSVDVRQKLLDVARGVYYLLGAYDLGSIALRHGVSGVDKDNPWRLRYEELRGVPLKNWPASALAYLIPDARAPEEIWQSQEAERARAIRDLGADPLLDEARASRSAWALWLVAAHGVVPCPEALDYYREWVARRRSEARKTLLRAGLLRLEAGEYRKKTKDMRAIVERAWGKSRVESLGEWLRRAGETPEQFAARAGLDSWTVNQVLTEVPKIGLEASKARAVADATGGALVPYPRTESGKYPTLDASTAEVLNLPELRAWLEYGSAISAQNRLDELTGDAPVHTRFDMAESGRSRSASPNFQNRPRSGPDRECFWPGRGLAYLVTDHDQLELSTVAQVLIFLDCGDTLARAINAGVDGHLALAADLLEISYEEAVIRYRAGDKAVKQMRTVAKAANFGFAGGLGAPGFVQYALDLYGVRVTLETARRVRDAWFRRWPEFRKYFKIVSNLTRKGGGLATVEQIGSGRLRGACKYTDACNTLFQGLGADLTGDVLYELQRDTRLESALDAREVVQAWAEHESIEAAASALGAHPRLATRALLSGARVENYVHDEYLLAVHYRPVREGALVVDPLLTARADAKEYVIRTVSEKWLPNLRPTATADACARWSKSSRDVRDEHGRRIVWEVCPEVDEAAQAIRDPGARVGEWAARVRDLAAGRVDPVKLDARLMSLVPGYRRVPDWKSVEAVIEESIYA